MFSKKQSGIFAAQDKLATLYKRIIDAKNEAIQAVIRIEEDQDADMQLKSDLHRIQMQFSNHPVNILDYIFTSRLAITRFRKRIGAKSKKSNYQKVTIQFSYFPGEEAFEDSIDWEQPVIHAFENVLLKANYAIDNYFGYQYLLDSTPTMSAMLELEPFWITLTTTIENPVDEEMAKSIKVFIIDSFESLQSESEVLSAIESGIEVRIK